MKNLTNKLLEAATKCDLKKVRAFLAAGATVATKSENAVTRAALGWWGGSEKPLATRLAVMEALIAAGCPVQGEALFGPAKDGNLELIRFLLKHGANANTVHRGETPLGVAIGETNRTLSSIAIKAGMKSRAAAEAEDDRQVAIVRELIQAGADVNQASGEVLRFGISFARPPLHVAAGANHPEIIRLLHEAGADLNAADKQKNTALLVAIELGNVDAVKALIDAGADLNKAGDDGWMPLALAKEKDNREIVRLLEAASAGVPQKFQQKEDFIRAACDGDLARVKRFIESGVDLEERSSFDCRNATALALAAEAGHLPIVTALLRAGAKVDAPDHIGRTPLFYAAETGHTEVINALLAAGADPNAKRHEVDEGLITPLVVAAKNGRIEAVRALLAGGADIAHRARSGKTALTAAAGAGQTQAVRVLAAEVVKRGKSRYLLDMGLWWAVAMRNDKCVEVLVAAGASPQVMSTYEGKPVSALTLVKRRHNKTLLRLLEDALKKEKAGRKP